LRKTKVDKSTSVLNAAMRLRHLTMQVNSLCNSRDVKASQNMANGTLIPNSRELKNCEVVDVTKLVILGGISSFYPTYFIVFTGIRMSRKDLRYEGALEQSRTQAPAESGHYLIS
jgi:hypothetical protein